MMNGLWRALALACACSAAMGQTAASPSFDVASVKLSDVQAGSWCRFQPGGRLESVSWVKQLVQIAYGVEDYQVIGGPGWFTNDRYDIQAKAANPAADKAEMLAMLRSLLADRFNLKLHNETREFSVYHLTADRNGAKLRPLKEGETQVCARGELRAFVCGLETVADLARAIQGVVHRPVFDKTGIKGRFDLFLDFDTYSETGRTPPPGFDRPSLAQALREELGLHLEAQKEPFPVLVIDSIERPTAN
jgi:uncharacterized protein (TIGR03435 family)